MHSVNDEFWSSQIRRILESYDETLLRQVATRLCRPRNHWPAEELIDRCLDTIGNAAMLDRRLKDHDDCAQQLLALIGQSRQFVWNVGNLVEMAIALGAADGLKAVRDLLEAGLLFPKLGVFEELPAADRSLKAAATGSSNSVAAGFSLRSPVGRGRLKDFEVWLAQGTLPATFAHPAVARRAMSRPISWPDPPICEDKRNLTILEADGLDWPLRLAVVWQMATSAPFRRTQQGDYFKRDLERLQNDSGLTGMSTDSLAPTSDLGLAAVSWGLAFGLLREVEGEVVPCEFPMSGVHTGCSPVTSSQEDKSPADASGLASTLAGLWAALPRLQDWNIARGWQPGAMLGNPYPSAQLLALALLAAMPEGHWARAAAVEDWLISRHPYWSAGNISPRPSEDEDLGARGKGKNGKRGGKQSPSAEPAAGISEFLLGIAYPLRLLQAARSANGEYWVRVSPMGRWILGCHANPPPAVHFPQTLLVQPNLEILAYRQGLTPALIARLSWFASWKTLGAACTLQLEPASVYRALQSRESLTSITQTLERHGLKALPDAVLEALKTWSNKRERIAVYSAAALFEFPGPAELSEALARGLPAVKLTDRLAIVPSEDGIDYRHFRLTGTRDYCLPPEQCIEVGDDGVTLTVDLARSDLLLETELQGLGEWVNAGANSGRRSYRLTPESLAAARGNGWSLGNLEEWFSQRTGLALSPAAKMLFTAASTPGIVLRRQLVLHLDNVELADGLLQWPPTRDLIQARLGPTAVTVAEDDVAELTKRCLQVGVELRAT
ncbi:MAG: helicase-associated domain-containing protein [Gemmataceae bacterium]|nr:helicase-associated domain-containing protein [Gemmataceae bacterium]MCI0737928.1 helicase-associated domain-containing protein [Gemmataceae bacterium]